MCRHARTWAHSAFRHVSMAGVRANGVMCRDANSPRFVKTYDFRLDESALLFRSADVARRPAVPGPVPLIECASLSWQNAGQRSGVIAIPGSASLATAATSTDARRPEIPLRLLHAVLRAQRSTRLPAAVETIRRRYPHAHYGVIWQPAPIGSTLPVWENAGVNLRYELGERDDDRKPVAYVYRSRVRLDVPGGTAACRGK